MSWLLAVCFPGLLMFCTVGLQRLESVLQADRPSAAEFVARLEQLGRAARDAAREAARECTGPLPLKNFSGQMSRPQPTHRPFTDEPGLPTRLCAQAQPNPHFQPTGYANPV
jgi:hypothetical protein